MLDAGTFNTANWVDLSTPDVEASRRFYRDLMGWEFVTQTTEMGDYHVAHAGDREVCGMMGQPEDAEGMPPMWTVFFYVEDLDAMVEKASAEGGQVLQTPFEIPGGARVAVVADPTGAMFALIAGGPSPEGVWMSAQSGSVCWIEVLTGDTAAAERFYSALFGWQAVPESDADYTTFMFDGERVAGMLPMPAEVPAEAPAHWAVYFSVEDCLVTEVRAVELGGSVAVPARRLDFGHFAVLEDPLGATFDIMDFAELVAHGAHATS